jgi:heterotetrameric sarcosine oxidase gamma subunit
VAEPSSWRARSAWAGVLAAGHSGRAGEPGLRVVPREALAIASIIARDRNSVARALEASIGIAPPGAGRCAGAEFGALLWVGPMRWLLVCERWQAANEAAAALRGLAAVADQSDAYAVLRLAGPRVRDALAKGCMIDLHPRAFAPGSVAVTAIVHVGATLWQVDDAPTYDIAVPRSMAASFWSWLAASAAEFGIEVRPQSIST